MKAVQTIGSTIPMNATNIGIDIYLPEERMRFLDYPIW